MRKSACCLKRLLAAGLFIVYLVALFYFHSGPVERLKLLDGKNLDHHIPKFTDSRHVRLPTLTTLGLSIYKEDKCSAKTKGLNGEVIEEVFDPNKVNNMTLFHCYPMNINFSQLINDTRRGKTPVIFPINSHPYKPLTAVNCERDKYFIVYLIKSRPENVQGRNVIRETWGNEHIVPGVLLKRIFLLGIPTQHKFLPSIFSEHQKQGDILMEDFVDVYLHTRVKMTMGFRWATSHCPNAAFLVFADDDVLINPWNLVEYLSSDGVRDQETFYSGAMHQGHRPRRGLKDQFFLATNEYPFNDFPVLAPAATMIVNVEFARRFVIASPYISPIHFDDVYLGIVARKLGVTPTHTDLVKVYCSKNEAARRRVIACLGEFSPNETRSLWATYYRGYYTVKS